MKKKVPVNRLSHKIEKVCLFIDFYNYCISKDSDNFIIIQSKIKVS